MAIAWWDNIAVKHEEAKKKNVQIVGVTATAECLLLNVLLNLIAQIDFLICVLRTWFQSIE